MWIGKMAYDFLPRFVWERKAKRGCFMDINRTRAVSRRKEISRLPERMSKTIALKAMVFFVSNCIQMRANSATKTRSNCTQLCQADALACAECGQDHAVSGRGLGLGAGLRSVSRRGKCLTAKRAAGSQPFASTLGGVISVFFPKVAKGYQGGRNQ